MRADKSLIDLMERMLSLYESAHEGSGVDAHVQRRQPLTEEDLKAFESRVRRLLPDEAHQLYRWHDGCVVYIAPLIGFLPFHVAAKSYDVLHRGKLPEVSNAPGWQPIGPIFPLLDVYDMPLCVPTSADDHLKHAPLYYLDLENDQLTLLAWTVREFVEDVIIRLESGQTEHTEHGVFFTGSAVYRFDPVMAPIGSRPSST